MNSEDKLGDVSCFINRIAKLSSDIMDFTEGKDTITDPLVMKRLYEDAKNINQINQAIRIYIDNLVKRRHFGEIERDIFLCFMSRIKERNPNHFTQVSMCPYIVRHYLGITYSKYEVKEALEILVSDGLLDLSITYIYDTDMGEKIERLDYNLTQEGYDLCMERFIQ